MCTLIQPTPQKKLVTHYKTPITNQTPPHLHTSDSVRSGFGSNESEGDLFIPSDEVEEGGIRDSVVKNFGSLDSLVGSRGTGDSRVGSWGTGDSLVGSRGTGDSRVGSLGAGDSRVGSRGTGDSRAASAISC